MFSVHTERETIRRIKEAVKDGTLVEPFTPAAVNQAIGINFAGVFLPKHRVGNPGFRDKANTELFVQIERGLYRLKQS